MLQIFQLPYLHRQVALVSDDAQVQLVENQEAKETEEFVYGRIGSKGEVP